MIVGGAAGMLMTPAGALVDACAPREHPDEHRLANTLAAAQ